MSDPPARNTNTCVSSLGDSHESAFEPQIPSDDDDMVILFDTPLAVLYKYPVPASIAANTPHDECPRVSAMMLSQSAMFVVARGRFSVYQLLGQTIAYVRCGSEFAHPILPRTRVWRIARAQYLLPQPVPRKFWRIELPESDAEDIRTLDHLFAKICSFQVVYEDDPAEDSPSVRSRRRSRQLPQTRVVSASSTTSNEMTSMLVRQYEEIMCTQQQNEASRIRRSFPPPSRRATSNTTTPLEQPVEDPFGFPLNSPPKPLARASTTNFPITSTTTTTSAATTNTTDIPLGVSRSPPLSHSSCVSPITTPSPSSPLFLYDYPSPTLSDIEACSSPKHNHMLLNESSSTGAYTPEFSSSSSTLDNILDDFQDTIVLGMPKLNSNVMQANHGAHDSTQHRALMPIYSLDEQVLAAVAVQRPLQLPQDSVYSASRCTSFTESSNTVVGDELDKDQETVTEDNIASLSSLSLSSSPETEAPVVVESKRMSLGRMISSAAVAAVAAAAATLYGDAGNSSNKHNGSDYGTSVTKRQQHRQQQQQQQGSTLTTNDWYGEYNRRRSRKPYGALGSLSSQQLSTALSPPLKARTLSLLGCTPRSSLTITSLPTKTRLSRSASTSSLAALGVMAVPKSPPTPGLGVRVFSPSEALRSTDDAQSTRSRRNSLDEDRNVVRTISMLTPAEKHAALFGTRDPGLLKYYYSYKTPQMEESNDTNPIFAMWGSK